MKNIQEIKDGQNLVALIFSNHLKTGGVKFLTPQNYPLQVGLIEHKKDVEIQPHRHRNLKYNVNTTQEFLYIEKGKLEATFYNIQWKIIKKIMLNSGDFLLCICGGHSFKVINKCRIIEVKQGPYPGDQKAKIFMK
ncbi:MAG: hypothetical protein ABIF17_00055 [Patescibacteria group bacterium]